MKELYRLEDGTTRVVLGMDRKRVFLIKLDNEKYSNYTEVIEKNVWKKLNPVRCLSCNWFEIAFNYLQQHAPEHLAVDAEVTHIVVHGKSSTDSALENDIYKKFWTRLQTLAPDKFEVVSYTSDSTSHKVEKYEHLAGTLSVMLRDADRLCKKVSEMYDLFKLAFNKIEMIEEDFYALAFDNGFEIIRYERPMANTTVSLGIDLENAEAEIRTCNGARTKTIVKRFSLSNPHVAKEIEEHMQEDPVWYGVYNRKEKL